MHTYKKIFMFSAAVITFTGNICALVDLSNARANSVIVQSDGKIVAAGAVNVGEVPQALIARYSSAGVLDNGFSSGVVTTVVGDNAVFNAVIQQSDGKLVAV